MFIGEIGPNCVFYLVLTFVISKTKEQLQQEKNELSVRHVKLLAPPHPDTNNIHLIGPPPPFLSTVTQTSLLAWRNTTAVVLSSKELYNRP